MNATGVVSLRTPIVPPSTLRSAIYFTTKQDRSGSMARHQNDTNGRLATKADGSSQRPRFPPKFEEKNLAEPAPDASGPMSK
jgi:hypothetical protein